MYSQVIILPLCAFFALFAFHTPFDISVSVLTSYEQNKLSLCSVHIMLLDFVVVLPEITLFLFFLPQRLAWRHHQLTWYKQVTCIKDK